MTTFDKTRKRLIGFKMAIAAIAAMAVFGLVMGGSFSGSAQAQSTEPSYKGNHRTPYPTHDWQRRTRTPTRTRTVVPLPTATATPCVSRSTMYAVTTANWLLRFNSDSPSAIQYSVPISGTQLNENILGIDFRPATGQLYALGSSSRLYTVNLATGLVTQVGAGTFITPLMGADFGFDFNPTVDRIRIVSDADQNLRVNPDTGAIAAQDLPLAYAAGDLNAGQNPNAVGAGYTNSVPAAFSTLLYDIDSGLDILVTQNPPNNGTLNTVGPLGVDTTGLVGLDIAPSSGTAFASLTRPGMGMSGLYTVNLANGSATLVGTIGGGALVRALAAQQ